MDPTIMPQEGGKKGSARAGRARFQRGTDGRALSFGSRDRKVLGHLFNCKLVSSDQLCLLIDGPRTRTRNGSAFGNSTDPYDGLKRRLKRLYDRGYVARLSGESVLWYQGQRRNYVYYLGPEGCDLWRRERGERAFSRLRWIESHDKKPVAWKYVEHTLMASQAYTALWQVLRQRREYKFDFWLPDGVVREHFYFDNNHADGRLLRQPDAEQKRLCRRPIAPDALFCVTNTNTGHPHLFVLEADRGTMERRSFLFKVTSYLWWYRHGLHSESLSQHAGFFPKFFTVLVVSNTTERAESLREFAADNIAWRGDEERYMFRFVGEETYARDCTRLADNVWRAPGLGYAAGLFEGTEAGVLP